MWVVKMKDGKYLIGVVNDYWGNEWTSEQCYASRFDEYNARKQAFKCQGKAVKLVPRKKS